MTGQQRFFAVLFYAAIFLGLASVIIDIVNEISNDVNYESLRLSQYGWPCGPLSARLCMMEVYYRKRFSKRLCSASCCVCRRLTRTTIICQEGDMGVHV